MKKSVKIIAGIIFVLAITFCSISVISARAEIKPEAIPANCYYTSIKINYGQTLDSIAEEYNTADSFSNSSYINEIKRINNLYTDTIHAGCYLTVMRF